MSGEDRDYSETYAAAVRAHDEAMLKYRAVLEDFRNRLVLPEALVQAQRVRDQAHIDFDLAYSAELARSSRAKGRKRR